MTANISGPRQRRPVGFIDEAVFGAYQQWIEFWFSPVDPAPLGLLRILIGGMLIYSHWVWGLDLPAFLGPEGWNSAEVIQAWQRGQWNFSFWWLVPEESMLPVHQWCLGILVLFWLGICTRITSVLAFVIHVSYCQRAPIANYGLDQIEVVLLLYLAIGPSGAAYSVDRLFLNFLRRRQTDFNSPTSTRSSVKKYVSAGLAIRLIQVHYCVIYFFASTAKLLGESWWTGEAIWNVIANYEYQSVDLTWLAWYPAVIQLITHITVFWELSFAYLVWVRPLRPVILILGVLMHLGIGAFLGMWTFGLAMIFGYVAFLKPETVRALMRPVNYLSV